MISHRGATPARRCILLGSSASAGPSPPVMNGRHTGAGSLGGGGTFTVRTTVTPCSKRGYRPSPVTLEGLSEFPNGCACSSWTVGVVYKQKDCRALRPHLQEYLAAFPRRLRAAHEALLGGGCSKFPQVFVHVLWRVDR